jgi:electron transport complex protein RnfA
MKDIFTLLFNTIFVNNVVLAQFLAICSFLGVSNSLETAMSMSIAVILVMLGATAITWPIYEFILKGFGIEYLQTLVFILVIAALVQIVEAIIKKTSPTLYKALGIYLPLITTNCAILAVALINVQNSYGFVTSMINSLGIGLGYMLAMFLFAGVRKRMLDSDIPKSLQGLPIILAAAAIVSVSFFGFKGIAENLFR